MKEGMVMFKESIHWYRRPFRDDLPVVIDPSPESHVGNDEHAVDFLLPEGTSIYAPADGVILLIKDNSTIGGADPKYADEANYIVLDHGNGETSILIHLAAGSVVVRPGQRVKAGYFLANQGSTGWTTEPHIHFAVYRNRVTVPVRFR